ncbi:YrhK family protein [Streptomyces sp. NBC_01089]|uniref:YrhK family protein n=1 Tax=Streptomyces sp. NBC_01089 TaxID=2903747 RepID=UPI0038658667|nr:YrhK family protein [Streptomyces sp. NBC_01089]
MSTGMPPGTLTLHIGREEVVLRRRYEVASILNDILVAVWFIVGSVMFFSEDWTTMGTWCFLIGSIELLIRPVIRLFRHLHIQRVRSSSETGQVSDSAQDY